ncbi:DUF433 domain-containing protein [Planktothrix sp. FACHB-1355]|uniref:DUF433 domain-containing protein n=1 Tax=Aerosakkonema funiforme FACHB-1375 TaxID=2949571 RepID=A0A926VBG6_9CYAN|nr:DUF433 domain-containing protein [Aerosakkonema funiforme]MBD2180273.1 DUF433 domain-containing protein [Aerosakkonema funiforme FACHB-1375]MBD3558759.1 DUF433 domain-containing protein [Planktothrix sp. FACHB-1355]
MLGFDRITFNPRIMAGQACIRGMRVPVSLILNLVANGKTVAEIIEDYSYLEPEDIQQSLMYAAWLARYEIINERLAQVLNRFEEDLAAGAIISVKDEAFRVRRLPI